VRGRLFARWRPRPLVVRSRSPSTALLTSAGFPFLPIFTARYNPTLMGKGSYPRGHTRMRDWSDAQLLERIKRGNDRALDALFARYERPLFLFLLGLLHDHHWAEDALQETFVTALQ